MERSGSSVPPPSWDQVRDLYPGTADVAYLDSAAVGLLSTRVREAMTAVLDGHQRAGIGAAPAWRDRADEVRDSLARLVGGRADRIAFTQNTSTGLATVTNGLDWREGDAVVVPAGEFPSNFYPWLQLRRRGVEVREVAMTGGHAPIDDLVAALDSRTRVLAISAVQYSSGHRNDLGALGAACRERDVLLVVDGTQAVGAVTVDVDLHGIDVLAVSAHKWLLGPFGIGFTHLSARAMERLTPSTVGWLSVEAPFAFDHEPVLAGDARRFESGTENSAGIAGLGATVDLVHELGRRRVEERVLQRAEQLVAGLAEVGLEVAFRDRAEHRSGIVIAGRPDIAPQVLHERLLSAGVRCSLRGNGLRFAPHYFTSDADLERTVEALRSAA
jgi:selenocysteine lyase/cysteine desulfurase